MAPVHDNLSQDNPKTKNSKKKDDEQAAPGVENALT